VTATRSNGIDKEAAYKTLVSYRTGDVWVPKLDSTEALHYVCGISRRNCRAAQAFDRRQGWLCV
jgi:hypothetical protein